MSVKKYSKSITVRIIVIMILLVIPLNIWGIVTAAHIQQSMYTESRNNIYGVGQLAMKDLDSRINSVDYYLFNTLQNSNNFFPLVRQQKGDEAFYHAAYNLHSDFFDRASFGRDAEMYFFYTKDVGYIDLAAGTNYSRMRQELQSDIKDMIDKGTYKKSNKWQLIELRDELWSPPHS